MLLPPAGAAVGLPFASPVPVLPDFFTLPVPVLPESPLPVLPVVGPLGVGPLPPPLPLPLLGHVLFRHVAKVAHW